MTDKERIHRWLTQADLERMLDDARAAGYRQGLVDAAVACEVPCSGCAATIRSLPVPEGK